MPDTNKITPEEKEVVATVATKAANGLMRKYSPVAVILIVLSSYGGNLMNSQDVATKQDVQEILEKIDNGDAERADLSIRVRETERELDKREFRLKALEGK